MSNDDKHIREFAYQIWESEGRPQGQGQGAARQDQGAGRKRNNGPSGRPAGRAPAQKPKWSPLEG